MAILVNTRNVLGSWVAGHQKRSFVLIALCVLYGFYHFGFESSSLFVIAWRILVSAFLILLIFSPMNKAKQLNEKSLEKEIADTGEKKETVMHHGTIVELSKDTIELFKEFEDSFPIKHKLNTERDYRLYVDRLLNIIKSTFGASTAALILQDRKYEDYLIKSIATEDTGLIDNTKFPPDNELIRKIASQNSAFFSNDVQEVKRLIPYYYEENSACSLLAAPVSIENNQVGLLVIDSIEKNAYSETDIEFIESYARIIADTIINYNTLFDFENSTKLFSFFYEVSKGLNANIATDEIYDLLFSITQKIFPYDRMTVNSFDSESDSEPKIEKIDGETYGHTEGKRFPIEEGLNGWVIRKQKPFRIADIEKGEMFLPRYNANEKSNFGLRSYLGVPILYNEKSYGSISLESREVDYYSEQHERILQMLSVNFGAALERCETLKTLETLAITDELTSLLNYRSFMQRLREEINRSDRYGFKFTLLMMDLDHFKKINDEHGHTAGNEVLKMVSKVLKDSIRNVDFVYRYGGEEFALILIEAGIKDAMMSADRMRSKIENLSIKYKGEVLKITVSVGVAEYASSAQTPEDFVTEADKALYKAKLEGRNRVVALNVKEVV